MLGPEISCNDMLTRGTDEQHALGDLGAHRCEALRALQELNNLQQQGGDGEHLLSADHH
jgi:hypothetical protein